MNVTEVLQQCTILDRKLIRLPQVQLSRTLYSQVNDRLKKIGGRWKGRPFNGFVFDSDPTELLADLQRGVERNIKKEFQFYETPVDIVDRMMQEAGIEPHHTVLEPSAGRGAIVRRIPKCKSLTLFELMPANREFLCEQLDTPFQWGGVDFLNADESTLYDRIVANPPWNRNQDIDHIRKMYSVLAPGGILVALSSTHWQTCSKKKEVEFREWLESMPILGTIEVSPGAFKASGASFGGIIIVIEKTPKVGDETA